MSRNYVLLQASKLVSIFAACTCFWALTRTKLVYHPVPHLYHISHTVYYVFARCLPRHAKYGNSAKTSQYHASHTSSSPNRYLGICIVSPFTVLGLNGSAIQDMDVASSLRHGLASGSFTSLETPRCLSCASQWAC